MVEKSKARGGNLFNDLEHVSGEVRLYIQVILRAITDLRYFNNKWKAPNILPLFLLLENDDPFKYQGYQAYKKRIGRSERHFITAINYIFAPNTRTSNNILWHLEHIIEGDCTQTIYAKVQEGALIALSVKPEVYEYVIEKYKENILEDVLKNLARDKLARETLSLFIKEDDLEL